MSNIKKIIIELGKSMTPPIIYRAIEKTVHRKTYIPRWTTLDYIPLKGIQLFLDPRGAWQKKMITNTYDTYFFDQLKKMNLTGKVVYDIGAHIGFHSFYTSQLVGSTGSVHAFEPHPKNADRIRQIIEKNKAALGNITVHEVAISDTVETVEFTMNNDIESGRSSGNFIGAADTFWNKEVYAQKGFIKATVQTVPIDACAEKLAIKELPDIIKIDVEGAEHLALQGARSTLLSKKPLLFIEVHSMRNMFDVLTFLHSISYTVQILNTDPNGVCFIEARAHV
jgi:FkbM family methyltransferase